MRTARNQCNEMMREMPRRQGFLKLSCTAVLLIPSTLNLCCDDNRADGPLEVDSRAEKLEMSAFMRRRHALPGL